MNSCTVLNASHEPLAVVSAERGLILYLEGKAVIIEEMPDKTFRSAREEFPVPTTIALKEYRKTGSRYYQPAQLNQRNLFIRDQFTCQYCLRHTADFRKGEYLTRDHVHPQSKGGPDAWENVIASCSTCNHWKDDRTLDQFIEVMQSELDSVQSRRERATAAKLIVDLDEKIKLLQTRIVRATALKTQKLRAPRVVEVLRKRHARLSGR